MSLSVISVEANDPSQSVAPWNSHKDASSTKCVYCFDPLKDTRWNEFVERQPDTSVFHSAEWLEALSRTYGYRPIAYTTSSSTERLENAIAFCRVESWLTGRRLVSLPFSDHCAPLAGSHDAAAIMSHVLEKEITKEKWRYVELRPLAPLAIATGLNRTNVVYAFHELDLSPISIPCSKTSTRIRSSERFAARSESA